jgi:hypothetical protein
MAKIFTNKAALVAASLTAGQIVSTKGYYTAGDGGGASYLIKTAGDYGATPDEYGDHTLANGNVAVLQHEGVLNVKQFGAKGDGVADDTAAIQAAWNASNPRAVFVPAGNLKVDSAITGKFYSFGVVTVSGSGSITITNLVP